MFNDYLGMRATDFKCDLASERHLVRIGCMMRLQNERDISILRLAYERLPLHQQGQLQEELQITGMGNKRALLLYYAPQLMVNLWTFAGKKIKSMEACSDEEQKNIKVEVVHYGLVCLLRCFLLARFAEEQSSKKGGSGGVFTMNVHKMALVAAREPVALVKVGLSIADYDNGDEATLVVVPNCASMYTKSFPWETMIRQHKNVLVIGLGGGTDCFSAFNLYRDLRENLEPPKDGQHTTRFFYGNACEPSWIDTDLHEIENSLYATTDETNKDNGAYNAIWRFKADLDGGEPRPLQEGETIYGSTKLEQSLPRGVDGPLLVQLSKNNEEDIDKLAQALKLSRFDLIIGIDNGGDAIAKAASSNNAAKPRSATSSASVAPAPVGGRDQMMLAAIKRSNKKCIIAVVAPCCDGETKYEDMRQSLGREGYIGYTQLETWYSRYAAQCHNLGTTRTPNIVLSAVMRLLDKVDRIETYTSSSSGVEEIDQDFVRVPLRRHNEKAMQPEVPRQWLCSAFFYTFSSGE